MANCGYCNSFILFGGKKYEGEVFCNDSCLQGGYVISVGRQIPEDVVTQHVQEVHQGNCPKCHGRGPVDVHTSHSIWSVLILTSWKSSPAISCRSCGVKSQLGGGVMSLFCGWWGLPWGLIMTPVQITRNVIHACSPPNPMVPSENLRRHVRLALASHWMAQQKNQAPPAS